MKSFIKTLIGVTMAIALVAVPVYADNDNHKKEAHNNGTTLEVHINDNGSVLVRGAKVTAISGSIISASTTFGTSTIAWTIDASSISKVIRRYGGNGTIADVQIGDYISFNGALTTTASGFSVKATSLKDWSIQVKNSSFSGTISSITGTSFVLTTAENKTITVNTDANTKITRGDTTVAFSALVVGDKISKTEGLYNNTANTLAAKSIRLYNDPLLAKRTFEGNLTSVVGALPPTTFTFESESKTYTVNVPAGISILSKNWMQIPLSSFQTNDTIRVYGMIQAANTSMIDATVVRNATR